MKVLYLKEAHYCGAAVMMDGAYVDAAKVKADSSGVGPLKHSKRQLVNV